MTDPHGYDILWLHRLILAVTPRLALAMLTVGREREFALAVVALEKRLRLEGPAIGEARMSGELRMAIEGPVVIDLEVHEAYKLVIITDLRLSGR